MAHYEYELKLKEHREQEDLIKFLNDINKGINNVFNGYVVPNSIHVHQQYFEFDLTIDANNTDLRMMGVEIAKSSPYLNNIKITYGNSTQIVVRRE